MISNDGAILAVMDLIAQLAIACDAAPITKFPGCWEHQIDESWWIVINGHDAAVKCSHGVEVQPFHAYVTFNGWPAGILNPYSGTMAAGETANEDRLCAAIQAALAKKGAI